MRGRWISATSREPRSPRQNATTPETNAPASKITADTIGRLAYIRYLYIVGVQQSRQPEPLSSASILTFHDSVELFLHLATEVWDAKPKADQEFIGYWDILQPHIPGGHLSQKESMRRLNKARVGLKHSGIWPNKGVTDGLRGSVAAFYDENTPLLFPGMKFAELSMVDLVRYPETRQSLKEAQTLLAKGELLESLGKMGVGFVQLLDEYEETKRTHHGRSPFLFGERFYSSEGISFGEFGEIRDGFVGKVRDSIEALQEAMKILSLGIDYRRYAKFRVYTPAVLRIPGGKPVIQWVNPVEASEEVCKSCLDFVIESAIQLQTSEYEAPDDETQTKIRFDETSNTEEN